MRTIQMTLPRTDWTFLKRLSNSMGWETKVLHANNERKVKMTEQEFREKLALSSAQGARGEYVEMRADETPKQFLERMVCM